MRPLPSTITSDTSDQEKLIREIQILFLEKLSIRVERVDADLLQTGAVDSVILVRLLLHLESHFGVHLRIEDLGANSVLSVAAIADLVAACRRAEREGPSSLGEGRNGSLDVGPAPATSGYHNLISEVQILLSERLLIRVDSPVADLFKTGALDSMTLVQLILELEEHFAVRLPMEDLDLDSFRSITEIADLIAKRKLAPEAGRFDTP